MNQIVVVYWHIQRLKGYGRNPRKNDHAIDRMMASIKEYGFRIPILVRGNGEVIDGHLRLKAALKMGLEQIPVIICDDWTEAKVKAFRLQVNQSANWADWNLELLELEISELKELGFDLALTGFDGHEIDALLYSDGDLPGQDATLELPREPVSRVGDLWICNRHRVLCGDATDREHTARLLDGAVPPLMVTDPPYGISFDPEWRERAGLGKLRQKGKVAHDDRCDWTEAYQLFPGEVMYVWHAGVKTVEVAQSLERAQFEIRSQIIWAKQHFALSRGPYHWQHEPCWFAVRRGGQAHWCGDRTQTTLWQVPNLNPFGGDDGNEPITGHGTQKPVALMRRAVLNHLAIGEAVYDPFLGSGTTLVAAELTDRICYGLEIEPRYVDVIVERWQQLSGHGARLADGRTFGEMKVARLEDAQTTV